MSNKLNNYQLESILARLLEVREFKDYAPNGMQIEGKPEIGRIAVGVTASLEVVQQAIAWKADALLVHHGYFWKGENPAIKHMKRKRLHSILANEINLYAYHLPLDCHPTMGNNVRLGELLGFDISDALSVSGVKSLLWRGELEDTCDGITLAAHIEQCLQRAPLHIPADSNKQIKRVAWCTGGAQDYIEQAAHAGVDAFISGEVSERTYHQAKELDIHYFACGHHATERYGIQSIGEYLATEYELEYQFFDEPNPI
jgi:dinuclear metal center YbgI/SA1388 family protein